MEIVGSALIAVGIILVACLAKLRASANPSHEVRTPLRSSVPGEGSDLSADEFRALLRHLGSEFVAD